MKSSTLTISLTLTKTIDCEMDFYSIEQAKLEMAKRAVDGYVDILNTVEENGFAISDEQYILE